MAISDRGTGPALVMVHGFPLDQTLWDGQSALEGKLRLVRFDLPGFGGSTATAGPASMGSYAEAVVAVMDKVGLRRAALCGLSMGGYLLFELWRRHPERVSALVLCDTRAEADTEEGRAARREGMRMVREGRRQQLLHGYLPRLLAPSSLADERIVARVQAMSDRASDEGIAAALQAMHDRPDSIPTLGSIRVPTLILVGSEDLLTPPAAARVMQAGIPGSQLQVIEGAGHLSPLERPEAFNAALAGFASVLKARPESD